VRIACVNQDPGISPTRKKGASVHLRAVRRALGERGAEVVPIDQPGDDAVLHELRGAGPLDLIYERHSLGAGTAARFADELGIPFVLELNAPLCDEARRWRGQAVDAATRTREAAVIAGATRVFAVSREVAAYALDRGAAPDRIEVVENGVDLERFRPRAGRATPRDELVPPGRIALGFHGRLRPWHGFVRLVAVFDRLLERGLPVSLVVVGEGDFERHLRGRDHVARVPWVDPDDVGDYVAGFDLLPLTYAPDSPCYFSPLKLTEAMACGVVPAVPDLGSLAGLVDDGAAGVVYDASRLETLVEALARLVERPHERARLAARALQVARTRSWASVADRILAVAQDRGGAW
jgi:glycosyltransferase involved in cell wall biosynthesis